jgi:purine-nucleoside phosphorylase
MLISDHISSFIPNPLVGPIWESYGPRFPDMSQCYSPRFLQIAKRCAKHLKLQLREGVYVAVSGPSYETPAEIRLFRRLGADAIGMSTVPEIIVARQMGLECLAISMITNMAAGLTKMPLSHAEVLSTAERRKTDFFKLLKNLCNEILKLE